MPNLKKKCNTCKHNYKANGDEPRCNRMCENFDEYKPMTNYEKIKAMSVEEMASFIKTMVDEDCVHDVACYNCLYYGCHHSDPQYKGTNLYMCTNCAHEGIGHDLVKWLESEVVE